MLDHSCQVCRTSAVADHEYFSRAFGESRRFAATSEAVADALGFCPQHGAALLSQAHLSREIVSVFRAVIPRLMPMLEEKYIYEEQVQRIFFAAGNRCPACAYCNRVAARQAGHLAREFSGMEGKAGTRHLETLCVAHFKTFMAELETPTRLAALKQYVNILNSAARAIAKAHQPGTIPNGDLLEGESSTCPRALAQIAGEPGPGADHRAIAIGDTLQQYPTLSESIAHANGCPLCLEVERARRRWTSEISIAAKLNLGRWLFFPACPGHIRDVVRIGDPELIAAVTAHALHVAAEHFRQQALALERADELRKEQAMAPIVRWGRRRRRKQSEPSFPTPLRPTRCPACERLGVAQESAIGSLLELLRKEKLRSAFNRGYGLCMKHFAQAYLISPKGVIRSMLAEDQRNRLADFALMLDEMAKVSPENGSMAGGIVAWPLALQRFCGFI